MIEMFVILRTWSGGHDALLKYFLLVWAKGAKKAAQGEEWNVETTALV